MRSTSYRFHILTALLVGALVSHTTHAADVPALIQFTDGTPAKAAEVNSNFTAIKDTVNVNNTRLGVVEGKGEDAVNEINANRGGNFISNPGFENGLTGWSAVAPFSTGALVRVGGVNGPFGQYAIENPPSTVVWGSSEQWIALDQSSTKSFYVVGNFRRLTSAGAGTVFLAVRLRDQDGVEITGDGNWWYYAALAVTPPANQWTSYKTEFGANTARLLPVNAKFATVGFILNYNGTTAGNHLYQVQGLEISANAHASFVCKGDMVSFGGGCISPLQPTNVAPALATFYAAQDACMSKYQGSVCMYHELARACASGAITNVGAVGKTNVWMGDHGLAVAAGANTDDEFLVTNLAGGPCGSNMDDYPQDNAALNHYRCCR